MMQHRDIVTMELVTSGNTARDIYSIFTHESESACDL